MTRVADDPVPRSPDVTMDYGQPEPTPVRWWRSSRADVQARIDGALEFLGMLLAMIGGLRRLTLAVALALLLGGVGDCWTRGLNDSGPAAMAVGGFLLGFVLPSPKTST